MTKASHAKLPQEIRDNPDALKGELRSFSKSSKVFSSDAPRLIDQFENKWVAVHDGKVAASARSLPEVSEKVKRLGIPLGDTMIRKIEKRKKTFIL